MKIDISDVKKWTILNIDWWLWKVLLTSHMHKWRWSATYSFKIKNIQTWQVKEISYKAWTTLESAEVSYKNWQYLYNSWDTYSFMEFDTSEIYDLPEEMVEDIKDYLKENMDVFLVIYQWNVIWIIIPEVVTYKVIDTTPGVKWDRAQAGTKPATLETWLVVQVPLHIEVGDEIELNTTTNIVKWRVK